MTALEETRATFRRWLHLPDTGALDAVLGSVAANRIEGDPIWLLLVGPPGGGKSEILNAISGLSDAYPAGTLTEASLLSGTPKKDHADIAKGGLLRSIGDFGIIVAKDFGSVLSMNRDARAQLLAALREVYDGAWTRHVGTDGGKTLSWNGKVGLVGGVTPTIDRHHAVMGAMGERFVLYRLPEVDPNTQARSALSHAGKEKRMRKELADAVTNMLEGVTARPRPLNEAETDRLVGLATLAVKARSAVERDSYSREIELVPGAEAPTRLIVVLDRLLGGLDIIGATRDEAWRVVHKVALDSIPALRLAVLYSLEEGQKDTNQVAQDVRHPAQTTRRALEDLTAHGLVEQERQGDGKAHLWSLSAFTRQRFETFPEMSETPSDPITNVRTGSAHAGSGSEQAAYEQIGKGASTAANSADTQGFPEMSETGETFPEMSRSEYTEALTSSRKSIDEQNGKPTNGAERNEATNQEELQYDSETRDLLELYVHAGREPTPADLFDPPTDDLF